MGIFSNNSDNSIGRNADNSYSNSITSGQTNPSEENIVQIQTAIVKEVISNPVDYFTKPFRAIIDGKEEVTTFLRAIKAGGVGFDVTNRELLDYIPRNTILGYPLEGSSSTSTTNPTFFLPFFSSHFNLPVKPGEQVWVIYEQVGTTKIGYWVSRKVSYRQVEDANYTHAYRERFLSTLQTQYDKITDNGKNKLSPDNPIGEENSKYQLYSFPDLDTDSGGIIKFSTSLPGEGTFDDLATNSVAYQNEFSGEPIPRHTKNCGDLTLQGSNNTLIHLGTDLTNVVKDKINQKLGFLYDENVPSDKVTPSTKPSTQSGMIDLVVGRFTDSMNDSLSVDNGLDPYEDLLFQSLGDDEKSVSVPTNNFNVVKNSRSSLAKSLEHYEVDKGVSYRLGEENKSEGQHSILNQKHVSARLFLSMNSDPDYLWSGLTDDYGEKTPDELSQLASFSEYGTSQKTREGNEKSAFVAYAERARIFAEDDVKIKNHNAMISFDKEGNIYLKSAGNASIILDKDGNVILTPGASGQILINNYYSLIPSTNESENIDSQETSATSAVDIEQIVTVGGIGNAVGTSALDAQPVINKKMGLESFNIEEFKNAGKSVNLLDFARDISHKVFKHKMINEHLPTKHSEEKEQVLEQSVRDQNRGLTPVFKREGESSDGENSGR